MAARGIVGIRFLFFGLSLIILAACSGADLGNAGNNVLRIGISPAAYPVSDAILSCSSENSESQTHLLIEILPAGKWDIDLFDFVVQLGEPDVPWVFAVPLATENLVAILNHGNPTRELSEVQIIGLLSGLITDWSSVGGDATSVQVWIGAPKDEVRLALETNLLQNSPVTGNAWLASNPELMLSAVASEENAIGFLPAAWVDSSVRSLNIGVQLPVLALASDEPSGEARLLLSCLQSEKGQEILALSYQPY